MAPVRAGAALFRLLVLFNGVQVVAVLFKEMLLLADNVADPSVGGT
jgi:hypothetical protein